MLDKTVLRKTRIWGSVQIVAFVIAQPKAAKAHAGDV